MGDPVAGVGSVFQRYNEATHAWEKLAHIRGIGGPNKSRNTIDTTDLDSVYGYKEFIGGLRDGGSITLNMMFTRDAYETMNNDFEDDDEKHYEIVLSDDDVTSFELEGLVTELPLNVQPDDVITCDVTIKVSGRVRIDSGSGPSPA